MFIEILKHTPLWVFVLFVVLIALGFWQSRPRVVTLQRASALPIAMIAFSGYGVWSAFNATPVSLVAWPAGLAFGVLLRQWFAHSPELRYSPSDRSFSVSGSWLPLALMMTIFFTRYAVSVLLARDSQLASLTGFVLAVCAWYGVLSGMFFANLLVFRRAARAASAVSVSA